MRNQESDNTYSDYFETDNNILNLIQAVKKSFLDDIKINTEDALLTFESSFMSKTWY